MQEPLINILIRTTKGREGELIKCIDSIDKQTYQNTRVIIANDYPPDYLSYIGNIMQNRGLVWDPITIQPTGVPFHWNFYCNNLKARVEEGWFFYLDDDDYLANPYCLDNIAKHLDNHTVGVICQFNRGSRAKPEYYYGIDITPDWYVKPESIIRGKIGGSCIFLHHSHKDIAMWDGQRAADYRFIKAVSEKIPLKWVPIVVVQAGNKGRRGK